jgi:hypothetical protein
MNPSDMMMRMGLVLNAAMIVGIAIVKVGRIFQRIAEHVKPDQSVQRSILSVEGLVEPQPGL